MKKLNFSTNEIKLEFVLLNDNRLKLVYAGLKKRKVNKINETELAFYNYVEAETTGNVLNHHKGLKNLNTSFAISSKYVSHKVNDKPNYLEVVITSKNNELLITTHYLLYKSCPALSTYSEVKNISKHSVDLEHISSFYNLGVMESNLATNYIYFARNSWHREAQWEKHKMNDVGIFNGNDFTSNGSFLLTNNGTWSTKEYLPMAVLEDASNKLATVYQIENNGSWHIEVGEYINQVYINLGGPDFNHNFWARTLNPNEVFKTCQVTVGFAHNFEESIQVLTKARRLIRRNFVDNQKLPIIFNDYMHALWDRQTSKDILPLVDIAHKVDCDIFCIDAGWFHEGDKWWNLIGDWREAKVNFPDGGLKAVIDYIHKNKMKAGLWIEIEVVGIHSPALKYLKDDYFFTINGKRVVHNERYQLDFANPKVYQYALKVIDNLMKLYHLDYLKIDYNIDAGLGTNGRSSNVPDGLLNHNRAFIRWLNEVENKYPNLTIENCASGGCRMDYEILKYAPIQSTSDQTDYRKYPYLAVNVLTACPPEQAAVWSYPVDSKKPLPNDEQVAMNMVNAMFGRIHLASFLDKLTPSQLELVKEGIKYYRSIIDFKKGAVPIYPKGPAKFFDKEVVGGIMNKNKIILGVWNTSGHSKTIKIDMKNYNFKSVKLAYPITFKTTYKFNKTSKILEVSFKENYAGRIFEFIK